jgi:hypothetical protein
LGALAQFSCMSGFSILLHTMYIMLNVSRTKSLNQTVGLLPILLSQTKGIERPQLQRAPDDN